MAEFDCDLFVIGGGSGGVRAARMAAATGAKVQLAEESRLGGTCVIRGCVPKKLMVFASTFAGLPQEAAAYGWPMTMGEFDWPGFRWKLHAELDRLEGVYRDLLTRSGVTVHDTRARVAGPHEVTLASGGTVSARHILIAVGGQPQRPDKTGAHMGIVSDDIFDLDVLPERILIVGGGYIACEFACILQGLGVQVTQYYRGAQILRGFDDEARGLVAEGMRARGIDLHLGTDLQRITRPAAEGGEGTSTARMGAAAQDMGDHASADDGPVHVLATTGHEGTYDQMLLATGRRPSTADLGLEGVGLTLGRRGEIPVDRFSQTEIPSIYAVGDVTNRANLTPVAIREGMAFVKTVFEGTPTPVDHDLIPSAIFTQPEMGTVGLTEEEAREREAIEVYYTSFRPMRTAFAGAPDRVLMKLVVSRESRRVLGCHIVAPDAGEMIQFAGVAIKMGATKEDFDRTCAVHPTMAEEMVTMRDPVRTTD
ncbi:MAG: FAD-dependent oxidoreductase [Paracoccaceae bacterium]